MSSGGTSGDEWVSLSGNQELLQGLQGTSQQHERYSLAVSASLAFGTLVTGLIETGAGACNDVGALGRNVSGYTLAIATTLRAA